MKSGPAISGIVPVTDDNGKHVGSFEIGMELPPMLDKIKEAYNIEASAFIEEKALEELATDLGGDIMTPKNRVGRFIRYYATHPDLAAQLITDKDIEISEPVHFDRTVAGTLWGVQLVPMYLYNGKQVGVYALAINQAQEKAGAGRAPAHGVKLLDRPSGVTGENKWAVVVICVTCVIPAPSP